MRGRLLLAVIPLLIAVLPSTDCSRILVDFHRGGGIAGVQERLLVFEDGFARAERRAGRTEQESFCARLEPRRLGDLQRALELADFPRLQPEYLPEHPVYDGYSYRIDYRGYSVRTQDPIGEAAPEHLQIVIRELSAILRELLEHGRVCPEGGATWG